MSNKNDGGQLALYQILALVGVLIIFGVCTAIFGIQVGGYVGIPFAGLVLYFGIQYIAKRGERITKEAKEKKELP